MHGGGEHFVHDGRGFFAGRGFGYRAYDWRRDWGWYGDPAIFGALALGTIAVASYGFVYAPPAYILPPPIYYAPPPIILGLPAIAPPLPIAVAAAPPPPVIDEGALITAAAAPPIMVLPPPATIALAGPPPVIPEPADCALVIAPPALAVAAIAPGWRSAGYITGYAAVATAAVATHVVYRSYPRPVVRYYAPPPPPVVFFGGPRIWGWGGPHWHGGGWGRGGYHHWR